jgi:hypothetical protein
MELTLVRSFLSKDRVVVDTFVGLPKGEPGGPNHGQHRDGHTAADPRPRDLVNCC